MIAEGISRNEEIACLQPVGPGLAGVQIPVDC